MSTIASQITSLTIVYSIAYLSADEKMGSMASQITSLTIVYSAVYSSAEQRKHQSSAILAFVRGIHRRPVNSPHKGPVTRKMFPFDDVIMLWIKIINWLFSDLGQWNPTDSLFVKPSIMYIENNGQIYVVPSSPVNRIKFQGVKNYFRKDKKKKSKSRFGPLCACLMRCDTHDRSSDFF